MSEQRSPEAIAADIVSEACIVGFNRTGHAGSGDPDVLRELIAAAIRAERGEPTIGLNDIKSLLVPGLKAIDEMYYPSLRKKFEGK